MAQSTTKLLMWRRSMAVSLRHLPTKITKGSNTIGILDLNENLQKDISDSVAFRRVLQQIIDDGIEYASNLAPERTGLMKSTIRDGGIEIDGDIATASIVVGEGAPYWVFVEYGTGGRGAASEQPEPGLPQGYQHGGSAGMAAQPFMRPTLWFLRQRFG